MLLEDKLRKLFSGKRCLITGGTGFIGSHLTQKLKDLNADVISVGNEAYDYYRSPEIVFSQNGKFDYVFNLAAYSAAGSWPMFHTGEQFYINNMILNNTLEKWRIFQPNGKFVNVGSICMFPDLPILKEEDLESGKIHPSVEFYGLTKLNSVKGVEAFKKQYKLKGTSVTLGTVYGPYDDFNLETGHVTGCLVRKFCDAVQKNLKTVEVWGDGKQFRELIFVEDQVLGILLGSQYDGMLINFGSGVEVQICELAETIKRLSGFQGEIVYNDQQFVGVKRKVLDISKAKELYGWTVGNQLTSLEDGLLKTIEYYKMCIDRREFIKNLPKDFKVGVEVGVREGEYSRYILENSNMKIFSVDPWVNNKELSHCEHAFRMCEEMLRPFGERSKMLKMTSFEASKMFEDESLDFVYIDALHDYDNVKLDIESWWPKVRKGGVCAGHDYSHSWPGVVNAVHNAFKGKEKIGFVYPRTENRENDKEYDGGQPSWFVVKK